MEPIAHGLVDDEGRLIEAEDTLVGLNRRAGGVLGQTLAVPQIAMLARLARRLRVPVGRRVVVADREVDVELHVRARPEGEKVRLTVGGWRERSAWRPAGERVELDLLSSDAEFRWECDAALRLTSVPIEAGRRHGFDASGVLGRPVAELFDFGSAADEAIADRQTFADRPASLRPSGRPVLVSAVARSDTGGSFVGFSGGVRLAEKSDTPPATESPAGLGDRLERALRMPLERIIADADLIQKGEQGPIDSSYAGYAADIAGAGRHLTALVKDLADLEAVERPDFAPEVEPLDLADVARRAAGLLSVRAADAGVTITRPGPDERLPAVGDFHRTLQILVNIVGNAIRYSPRGGTVRVIAKRKPSGARITVSDSGKGIAPQDQERIFGKFERVDSAEPGGSGLGLYISRRLARAMGGDITVKSAPGQGARFSLTLPADG